MKKGLTEVIFIVDKSGSMQPLIDDTIGGFNGFVDEQKTVDGEARLTTILFNEHTDMIHNCVDIREVSPLDRSTYVVGGGTAMLDAIGEAIETVQKRIDNTPEDGRPENVVCVITTDGQENSSKNYSKSKIQSMIDHQTNGHGWQFIFLGANMDAVSEAASIGIYNSATYFADRVGTQSVYSAVDCAVKGVRGNSGSSGIPTNWCDQVTEYTKIKTDC